MKKCGWCGSTRIQAVPQDPYIHYICRNREAACGHEWDEVEKRDWTAGLNEPVKRKPDYGEFERRVNRTAQAPDKQPTTDETSLAPEVQGEVPSVEEPAKL